MERELMQRSLPVIDGLVVASSRVSDTDLRTMAKQVPVMVLNRLVQGLPSLVPDNARGVRRATEHLAELGHREIWYVAGTEASWADGVRWRSLREAAHEVFDRGGRAVIAYNDLMAFGIRAGCASAACRCPTT